MWINGSAEATQLVAKHHSGCKPALYRLVAGAQLTGAGSGGLPIVQGDCIVVMSVVYYSLPNAAYII